MKTAQAVSKENRMSPFRVRLVVDLIRGKHVDEAESILENLNKRAAKPVLKTLLSAKANAVNNFGLDPSKLVVSEARADEGRTDKRYRAGYRGSPAKNFHRRTHITIEVKEA